MHSYIVYVKDGKLCLEDVEPDKFASRVCQIMDEGLPVAVFRGVAGVFQQNGASVRFFQEVVELRDPVPEPECFVYRREHD